MFLDRCLLSQLAIAASGCWYPVILCLLSLQLYKLLESALVLWLEWAFLQVVRHPSAVPHASICLPRTDTKCPALHAAPCLPRINPGGPAECQGHQGRARYANSLSFPQGAFLWKAMNCTKKIFASCTPLTRPQEGLHNLKHTLMLRYFCVPSKVVLD